LISNPGIDSVGGEEINANSAVVIYDAKFFGNRILLSLVLGKKRAISLDNLPKDKLGGGSIVLLDLLNSPIKLLPKIWHVDFSFVEKEIAVSHKPILNPSIERYIK